MKAQQKETFNYGFKREIDADFEQTVERTKKALKAEGFGVLSEICIDEKLKEKLGVDFRRYVILGACNPSLAYQTLQEDINIGLLLPCNVIVYEADNSDRTIVAAIDAKAMMSVVGQDGIEDTAAEVNEKLQKALEQI